MIRGVTYYSEDWKEADEAASLKEGENKLSPFTQVAWMGETVLKNYYLSITDRRLIMGTMGFFNTAIRPCEYAVNPIWELPLSEIAEIKSHGQYVEITTLAGDVISLHYSRRRPVQLLEQLAMKVKAERCGASFEMDLNAGKLGYPILKWIYSQILHGISWLRKI